MSKISVVIPLYNAEKYIGDTLESVLAQTYNVFEIIVVNDGSTDSSLDVVKKYSDVTVISQENQGEAGARNKGVVLSKGDFIAFMDHDDLWVPDKLKIQMEYFENNPQVGLVYSQYTSFRDGKILRTRPQNGYSGWIFTKLLYKSIIQASTVIVKRECLDVVGPYDEAFAFADEYDMFLRVSKKFQCGFVDKGLTRYRVHDTNSSKNVFLFDKENLGVYKKIYDNFTDLDGKQKKILRKRIARYSMKVAEGLFSQGKLEESKEYQKEALNYLPFYKRITSNLIFKT
ncbi:MAG: glycosyltransferase family 2 protein [Candidatus Scalindua sp.]